MNPNEWNQVYDEDIQPQEIVIAGAPVYYRSSVDTPIPGQIEGGTPIFWQRKLTPDGELQLSDLVFWQELGGGRRTIYWCVLIDNEIDHWRLDDMGQDEDVDESMLGSFDSFNIWHPELYKRSYVELLHRHHFESLTKTSKHCLGVMLLRSNDAGRVYGLSDLDLVEMTGYSKDTISKHLKLLEKARLIKEINKKKVRIKVNGQYQEKTPKNYQINFGYKTTKLDGVHLHRIKKRRL